MAFIHGGSEECTKSELDFSKELPHKLVLREAIEIPLLAVLSKMALLDFFFIAWNGEDYIDLNNTLLYLCCKTVKENGTDIDRNTGVTLVNYSVVSIFSQLDAILGDFLIGPNNNCYPYQAFIEAILQLQQQYFSFSVFCSTILQSHAGTTRLADLARDNKEFINRAYLTNQSRKLELLKHL